MWLLLRTQGGQCCRFLELQGKNWARFWQLGQRWRWQAHLMANSATRLSALSLVERRGEAAFWLVDSGSHQRGFVLLASAHGEIDCGPGSGRVVFHQPCLAMTLIAARYFIFDISQPLSETSQLSVIAHSWKIVFLKIQFDSGNVDQCRPMYDEFGLSASVFAVPLPFQEWNSDFGLDKDRKKDSWQGF